jgi:AcrR family transcriptional regulator
VTANLGGMEATRTRVPAAERREQVTEIALRHFAEGGFNGTSTEAIAAEVGVSQPYLFRLFRTKRDLFVACCALCTARIRDGFRDAAEGLPREERLQAMGHRYMDLLADRHLLRFHVQMYAACADDAIRADVRRGFTELVDDIRAITGAEEEELWRFFASGMMLNVISTMDLGEADKPWAASWVDPKTLLADDPPC